MTAAALDPPPEPHPSIPYNPMFMDDPPSLLTRLKRQRLPAIYRGRRWTKRGYISRAYRKRLWGLPLWHLPRPPRTRYPSGGFFMGNRHLERPAQFGLRHIIHDMNVIVRGNPPSRRDISIFGFVSREAVRVLNAEMRELREARYR